MKLWEVSFHQVCKKRNGFQSLKRHRFVSSYSDSDQFSLHKNVCVTSLLNLHMHVVSNAQTSLLTSSCWGHPQSPTDLAEPICPVVLATGCHRPLLQCHLKHKHWKERAEQPPPRWGNTEPGELELGLLQDRPRMHLTSAHHPPQGDFWLLSALSLIFPLRQVVCHGCSGDASSWAAEAGRHWSGHETVLLWEHVQKGLFKI